MLPDRVSNPGPLTYESGALPIALRGPANERVGGMYWTTFSSYHPTAVVDYLKCTVNFR